jgi:hypothetical protein
VTDHIPTNPTQGLPRIEPEIPMRPNAAPAVPRPRDDEPKPFHAAQAWLVAYA